MAVRIVFGIMSATQSGAVVDQLAGLLAPHRAVVHHDFEKRPDFRVSAANIELIPDPKLTGWGTWGFSEAILHTIRHALKHGDFDYFQLLSPTCLPIRPLAEYEAFLTSDRADAHVDLIAVDRDDDTLMTFGYRTYLPSHSLRFRLLRRMRSWYFGDDSDLVQTRSLSMLRRRDEDSRKKASFGGRASLVITKLAAGGQLGTHPFGPNLRPMIGGTFFGARRSVCEYLAQMSEDEQALAFFRELKVVDETLFATLLANSGFELNASNHAINDFNEAGNPRWIEGADLDRLFTTGRFFARKFVDDPEADTRRRAIARVRMPPDLAAETKAISCVQANATSETASSKSSTSVHRTLSAASRSKTPIVFGLMSAQQPSATVAQLLDAVNPYPVVVHHDFTKRREFNVTAQNAILVPDPKVTGWGTWGFVEAIFRTVEYALERYDFDYFQLLSPTCLPIRPLSDFEEFVRTDPAEIHADMMSLDTDDDILMTFGYRTFISGTTLRFKILQRARSWYFGDDSDLVQRQSLSILKRRSGLARSGPSIGGRASLALTRMLAAGRIGAHPFGPALRPMVGSTWFGARRHVCEYLVRASKESSGLAFFQNLRLVDEILFPTLLGNSGFKMGPSNHVISPFNDRGNPEWIDDLELDSMLATKRFFARKFPEDTSSPVRLRALEPVMPLAATIR
jgi:hypothetical protein